MGNAMRDTDNQLCVVLPAFFFQATSSSYFCVLILSLTPTLTATWLACRMVEIIESGLSDHLVTPNFAALLLPSLRSAPEWFRWIVSTVKLPPLSFPLFPHDEI